MILLSMMNPPKPEVAEADVNRERSRGPLDVKIPMGNEADAEALRPFTFYASHLRALMPKEMFELAPLRVGFFLTYFGLAAAGFAAFMLMDLTWPIKLALAVVIGFCYGGLGFTAHEVLHGSVVRNKTLQDIIAFFSFMPFFISPTFWRYWHNQLHHGKTQSLISDPDAFPLMRVFKNSKFIQRMFPFTPGSGHLRSYTYFFFWFSFHVFVAQTYLRFRNSLFDRLDHKRTTWEMSAQIAIMATVIYLAGLENILYTFFIPLWVQNYFVMSYIATNHNLNPLTRVNDPLVNSLTVTSVPAFEWIQLNFGYHVEHHVFPAMSPRHSKHVHELLKKEFPKEYTYMPKWKAMGLLYKTARIYKDSKTLYNPETGKSYPTI